MKAIQANQENGALEEVEVVMESTPSKKHSMRLLAIRLLLEGRDRSDVVKIMNKSESTIIRWIKLWNQGGIDALVPKPKTGRPRKVDAENRRKIVNLMKDPESAGQTHWTVVKLWGYLKEIESIHLGYSTLARLLHEEKFCRKFPRPWPEKQDEELRAKFKAEISDLYQKDDLELWFCDESGFLADPRPRQVWVMKGSKVKTTRTGAHLRESIVGAVCPKTGQLSAMVINHVDTDVFQVFLNQFAEATEGRKIVLVLDNASWHKTKRLNWHHIKPIYLPPYSPDLNPIERLWLVMKDRFFTQWYTNDREKLTQRVCDAFNSFIKKQNEIQSICAV